MEDFTHINSQGRAQMVDVTDKAVTSRTARAYGAVYMSADTIKMKKRGRPFGGPGGRNYGCQTHV